jgi:hypothetical protein
LGLGFVTSTVFTVVVARGWLHRPGPVRFLVVLALMVLLPLIGAIAMPDFKTGMLLWFGFPIGWVLSQSVALPLRHLLRRR